MDVIFWDEPEHLATILIEAVEARMNGKGDDRQPYEIWRDALGGDPTAFQILTPHRGEMHGVEAINEACQTRKGEFVISRVGCVDGITLFDKVIQTRSRPKSNPIWAYEAASREKLKNRVI